MNATLTIGQQHEMASTIGMVGMYCYTYLWLTSDVSITSYHISADWMMLVVSGNEGICLPEKSCFQPKY